MATTDRRAVLGVALLLATSCGGSPARDDARGVGGSLSQSGSEGTAGTVGGSSSSGSGGIAGATTAGGGSGGAVTAGTSAGGASPAPGPRDCVHDSDGKTTLAFVNRCSQPLTYAGSDIVGGTLASSAFACVDIGNTTDALSAKRYWAFAGQDPGAERHTLAEFTFNTDFNDFDWYNISHVDAHNLPLQIVPLARPSCATLTCADDFLAGCPEIGKIRNASSEVVSCVSPERDDGQSEVALYFEGCDDAYAWSGDDQNGSDPSPVRACAGEDWELVFCPEP